MVEQKTQTKTNPMDELMETLDVAKLIDMSLELRDYKEKLEYAKINHKDHLQPYEENYTNKKTAYDQFLKKYTEINRNAYSNINLIPSIVNAVNSMGADIAALKPKETPKAEAKPEDKKEEKKEEKKGPVKFNQGASVYKGDADFKLPDSYKTLSEAGKFEYLMSKIREPVKSLKKMATKTYKGKEPDEMMNEINADPIEATKYHSARDYMSKVMGKIKSDLGIEYVFKAYDKIMKKSKFSKEDVVSRIGRAYAA